MTASATRTLLFVTHAEVVIDPAIPIQEWRLSEAGRDRHARFAAGPAAARVGAVYSSTERKAVEGAELLVRPRGLLVRQRHDLGENDRSATGYLPPAEFQRTADTFFAEPAASIRGWERAVDAQRRVVAAIDAVLAGAGAPGDIAVVAHGGVGALLLAHLLRQPIARSWDQPGANGGHFFTVDIATRAVLSSWQPIA